MAEDSEIVVYPVQSDVGSDRGRTKKKSETASQEPVPGQVYEKNPNETPMYQ